MSHMSNKSLHINRLFIFNKNLTRFTRDLSITYTYHLGRDYSFCMSFQNAGGHVTIIT